MAGLRSFQTRLFDFSVCKVFVGRLSLDKLKVFCRAIPKQIDRDRNKSKHFGQEPSLHSNQFYFLINRAKLDCYLTEGHVLCRYFLRENALTIEAHCLIIAEPMR